MLLFHEEVFDEFITGTTDTWLTSARFNGVIGAADWLRLFAVASDVDGSPGLKVYLETSGDNKHWDDPDEELLDVSNLSSTKVAQAEQGGMDDLGRLLASFARLRVELTASGGCRLQLYVTGRSV